ncbi:MAG: hypothetical protein RLY86_2660 [Pseudomonadota bacterium]|jgi:leucyl aminopeptidase
MGGGMRKGLLAAVAACAVTAAGIAGLPGTAAAVEVRFDAGAVPTGGHVVLPMAGAALAGPAAAVDAATGGALARAMAAAGYKGDEGAVLSLYALGGYDRITLIGLGDGPVTTADLRDLGARAAQNLGDGKAGPARLLLDGLQGAGAGAEAASVGYGADLGGYRFDRHLTGRKDTGAEPVLVVQTTAAEAARDAYTRDWAPVAAGVAFARDLANEPANILYPESFVERTRAAFKDVKGVTIEVMDVPALEKAGMGLILGVGQGSAKPPRLLVVRYQGAGNAAPVVFAGKGVTFDTGGISLKEPNGMWRMKYDMSGAAAATGAVLAIAKRGARVNVVAVAALVENMADGNAIRPGDILTSASGKTVEVLNTDAEGRLILADAIWYAQKTFNPTLIVDLATLTGSIRTALGDEYGGLFTRQDEVAAMVTEAGKAAGEEVWRMPLHPSYAKEVKSDVADLKNVIEGSGLAGAGTAAQFIATFVEPETRWAHLDMASTGWSEGLGPTVSGKGLASGWGVRLLDQLVRDRFEGR